MFYRRNRPSASGLDPEAVHCDTPTRLHRHESEAEMQTCLENQGYSE